MINQLKKLQLPTKKLILIKRSIHLRVRQLHRAEVQAVLTNQIRRIRHLVEGLCLQVVLPRMVLVEHFEIIFIFLDYIFLNQY